MTERRQQAISWAFFLLLLLSLSSHNAKAGNDTWTVDDNIGVGQVDQTTEGASFIYSPDRTLVAFVALSTRLETDEYLATLEIFQTESLQRFASAGISPPSPVFEAVMPAAATGRVYPPLRSLVWSHDSSTLLYICDAIDGAKLLAWDRTLKAVRQVASWQSTVTLLRLIGEDQVAVAIPRTDTDIVGGLTPRRPVVATGRGLAELLFGEDARPYPSQPSSLSVIDWRVPREVRHYDIRMVPSEGVTFAPDMATLAFEEPMAAEWTASGWRHSLSADSANQIALLDLRTGAVSHPFNAPTPAEPQGAKPFSDNALIAWSPNGRSGVAAYTYTDLDRRNNRPGFGRRPPGTYYFTRDGTDVEAIRVYQENADGQVTRTPEAVEWSADGSHVTITVAPFRSSVLRNPIAEDEAPRRFSYERRGGRWARVKAVQTSTSHESADLPHQSVDLLQVRQNLNTPPEIVVAVEHAAVKVLEDLAPHARGRRFGVVEPVSWKDAAGHSWDGILALPVDFRRGKRYSLLIQTHGIDAGKFFAEGPGSTSFPGRAALDRGFVVLTMNDTKYVARVERPSEAAVALEGYRSAIAYLAGNGLVDPSKVGVIGWSRTSYYVKYALTHAPKLFKAAVCADGVDYSYMQYMLSVDLIRGSSFTPSGDFSSNYYSTYGGSPWQNSIEWRSEAPDFNLNEVQTPVRIDAASSRLSVLWEWEFYAGLRYNRIPADLVIYPQGQHELARPLDRKVSTEGALDWMDFWVNRHEDPKPAKVVQYALWRELADIWSEQKACDTCRRGPAAARK